MTEHNKDHQIDQELVKTFTDLTAEELWDIAHRDVQARYGPINQRDHVGVLGETEAFYNVLRDLQKRFRNQE